MSLRDSSKKMAFGAGPGIVGLTAFFAILMLSIGLLAGTQSGDWRGCVILGSMAGALVLLCWTVKFVFRADGFSFRILLTHRVIAYGEIEEGFFKTVHHQGQGAPMFHIRLRSGDSFKLNLRLFSDRAAAAILTALDDREIPITIDTEVAAVELARIRSIGRTGPRRNLRDVLFFLMVWLAAAIGSYFLLHRLRATFAPSAGDGVVVTMSKPFQIAMAIVFGLVVGFASALVRAAMSCRRGRFSDDPAVNSHYGRVTLVLGCIFFAASLFLAGLLTLAADTYIAVTPKGIVISPFWSFRQERHYRYDEVRAIYEWHKKHGKQGQADEIRGKAIIFADGRRWNTDDGGYSLPDFSAEFFSTIEARSSVKLKTVEFEEEVQ